MIETQLARAAANSLWWWLKRERWQRHKTSRVLDPTGNPTSHRYAPATFPTSASNPRNETIEIVDLIRVYVWPEDWPTGECYAVELTRPDHDRAVAALPDSQKLGYLAAVALATCRSPFRPAPNRHGKLALRRCDDPAITSEAAAALEAIAFAAEFVPITRDVADALIEDHEIDLAALSKALDFGLPS